MTELPVSQEAESPAPNVRAVNLLDDTQAPDASPAQYGGFALPDGIAAPTAEHDAAFAEAARELGMSQESAQDAYVLSAALLQRGQASRADGLAARAAAAHAATVAGYVDASRYDREFGGERLNENLAVAAAAMRATATPALVKLLNDTGLGNHPEVVRYFLTIAPKFSESKFVSGGRAPVGEKPAAKVLYPDAK